MNIDMLYAMSKSDLLQLAKEIKKEDPSFTFTHSNVKGRVFQWYGYTLSRGRQPTKVIMNNINVYNIETPPMSPPSVRVPSVIGLSLPGIVEPVDIEPTVEEFHIENLEEVEELGTGLEGMDGVETDTVEIQLTEIEPKVHEMVPYFQLNEMVPYQNSFSKKRKLY